MKEALKRVLSAMEAKKALDIVVLDISEIASFANHFVICSGDNQRQIQAIADEVQTQLRQLQLRPNHVEGYRNAEWVLLDYVDTVVHVFSKNARSYYDLERLWRDARRVEPRKAPQPRRRKAGA